jgi:hypothetical protein
MLMKDYFPGLWLMWKNYMVLQMNKLFHDYNSVGITSIGDRDPGSADLELYKKLHTTDQLAVSVAASQHIETIGPIEEIQTSIRCVADDPLFKEHDNFLRIIVIKTYMDGGMLTDSARGASR